MHFVEWKVNMLLSLRKARNAKLTIDIKNVFLMGNFPYFQASNLGRTKQTDYFGEQLPLRLAVVVSLHEGYE